jgi:hypothetical protein
MERSAELAAAREGGIDELFPEQFAAECHAVLELRVGRLALTRPPMTRAR